MKKIEEQRFEFVLYINKHIICQRYFSIKDYNENVVNSLDLKELMDKLVGLGTNTQPMGIIPSSLKKKSMEFLWKNTNQYFPQKPETYKNIFEKEDTFDFEIRVDKQPIALSTFPGNYFPQTVRYQVDIKDIIPTIISEIKDVLSKNKYNTKYATIEL